MWEWLCGVLGVRYPVRYKECRLAGFPVSGYAIRGLSAALAAAFDKARQRRFLRTVRAVVRRIRKDERRRTTVGRIRKDERCRTTVRHGQKEGWRRIKARRTEILADEVFLFCQWESCGYPSELLLRFYLKCRQENRAAYQAQQLIVLDAEPGDDEDRATGREKELTFLQEIYADYNYMTIVTGREEIWRAFAEAAYEEYGLTVRCVRDGADVTFREKKTLIMDLCSERRECCRNFPKESLYLDMHQSQEKMRGIHVKCREIPYISLLNVLDTALKDTV